MKARKLYRICPYCKRNLDNLDMTLDELYRWQVSVARKIACDPDSNVSHGVCNDCLKRELENR